MVEQIFVGEKSLSRGCGFVRWQNAFVGERLDLKNRNKHKQEIQLHFLCTFFYGQLIAQRDSISRPSKLAFMVKC
jgi:hypothetical protein